MLNSMQRRLALVFGAAVLVVISSIIVIRRPSSHPPQQVKQQAPSSPASSIDRKAAAAATKQDADAKREVKTKVETVIERPSRVQGVLIFLVVLIVYFFPAAAGVKKRNAGAIFMLNLCSGGRSLAG